MCSHEIPTRIPTTTPVATSARPLNAELWDLLLKPGPLTAAEWAYIDACERVGSDGPAAD